MSLNTSQVEPTPVRTPHRALRAALRILPIVLAIYTGLLSALVLLRSSKIVYNDMRGGPALGVAHGYSIYPMGLEDISFDIPYGPLSYLFGLPATLFHSPRTYFLAGCLISFLLYCAPLIFFLIRLRHRRQDGFLVGVLLAAGFILFTLNSKSLVYSAASFTPDAAAIGFVGLACTVMYFYNGSRPWLDPALIAIFACCAAGSKQNVVIVVFVLPLFALVLHGRAFAIRLTVCMVLAVSGVTGLIWAVYRNLPAVYFNNYTIPRGVPMLFRTAPAAAQLLYAQALPLLLAIACLVLLAWSTAGNVFTNPAYRRVWLFPAMALCLTPLSIMGMCWWGGDVNALSPALYFTLLSLLALSYMLLVESHSGWPERPKVLAMVAFFAVLNAPLFDPFATRPAGMSMQSTVEAYIRDIFHQSPSDIVYRYDLAHPAQVFFPYNQCSVFFAEQKFYHAEWGLATLVLAKFPFTTEQVWRHVPPAARYVAYPPGGPSRWFVPYIAPSLRRVTIPELPGFDVFEVER